MLFFCKVASGRARQWVLATYGEGAYDIKDDPNGPLNKEIWTNVLVSFHSWDIARYPAMFYVPCSPDRTKPGETCQGYEPK